MARTPDTSPQTVAVLLELLTDPTGWRHGYDLAKATGLASGTLYPILARLAARQYLDKRWEDDPAPGRPPRQLYRLTPSGAELARSATEARAARDGARERRTDQGSPRPGLAGA